MLTVDPIPQMLRNIGKQVHFVKTKERGTVETVQGSKWVFLLYGKFLRRTISINEGCLVF